jgi:hypothetical protein
VSVGLWSYDLTFLLLSSIMHRSEEVFKVKRFDETRGEVCHWSGLEITLWFRQTDYLPMAKGTFDWRLYCPSIRLQ